MDEIKLHPIGNLASTYRSGTQWLYYCFKDAYRDEGIKVWHEAPLELMIAWPGIQIGFTVGMEAGPLKYIWPDVPLIHITRDPVKMAISSERKGYKRADIALEQWIEINERILAAGPDARFKVEDLWANPHENLNALAEIMSLPRRNFHWAETQYDPTPEWREGHEPQVTLTPRARELASQLGYVCG